MTGPSDDGQAGVTVTDADRSAAIRLLVAIPDAPDRVALIADALAAERAKARAPFLALADELEAWATENDSMEPTNTDGLLRSITAGRVTRRIAQDIRRAAEEGQR